MAFLTDRKRAEGLGSAKTGTEHHWKMMVSSAALIVLMPLFVFTFGMILGAPYEEVVAYYQRPFPAVVAILTMLVGWFHFRLGVQTLIEDYVHGTARKITIIAMICLSYSAAAFAVFAIVRLAL
ncbi:succinate dehydrogenase, hydrophobic membrane anchor protein [Yoonia sediminilitoris]|uniref:Succinate dehydrogenase hydrophobic membrane anchor subunit n=1 Tax=Yoonia sediminilitoris TaxID=1286148 RepID=A0A2T6KKA1_9RHOB|nr:succinate dehydrogenase, hydrophobic membrane anchor protein [Yoonia sediminilitoris]PUB16388.1 succinate dehydrogenase subunit D [Yoonia sediminilitoris]RCW96737.1 succinate dehydrogenase subunit D [Yoonia sediminilitoris]